MSIYRAFIVFACLCLTPFVHADERKATQQHIEQVKKDIQQLQQLLKQTQGAKSGAERELQRTEESMGELEKKVRQLEEQIKNTQHDLGQLNKQETKLQKQRLRQQELIALQGRAVYQAGHSEPLRLLLNQQQPGHLHHNLTYYQYMHKARAEQVNRYNQTLAQISDVQARISAQQSSLEQQKKAVLDDREKLAELRQQRKQAVAKLARQQQQQQKQLDTKKRDQQELNALLKTIDEALARQAQEERLRLERAQAIARQQQNSNATGAPLVQVSSAFTHPGGQFDKARGKLPWPVSGALIAQFGAARGDSRSQWDGVLIQAQEGATVHAIHPGRVVFADWLRGAGLLIILDHGNGYLSLYGHNQSLLSSTGDTVAAGQAIATVGNSGGQANTALYFGIRKQGKALDPSQWCRA